MARAGIDASALDEVIMGNVVQGGVGQAPARQAAIKGGIPATVPAFTVNKVCGSGLQAVMLAAQAIRAGERVELTNKEFALLHLLLSREGEVLSRTYIASQVWRMNFDSDTNVVDEIGRAHV